MLLLQHAGSDGRAPRLLPSDMCCLSMFMPIAPEPTLLKYLNRLGVCQCFCDLTQTGRGGKGSRVRGFEGSRGQGVKGSRVRGVEGSRGQGVEGSRGRGVEGSRGRGVEGSRGRGVEGSRGRRVEGAGRRGDGETGRRGDGETGRRGDGETGRRGDGETGRRGDGETGRRAMGDGRWAMGDGRWAMGDGTGSLERRCKSAGCLHSKFKIKNSKFVYFGGQSYSHAPELGDGCTIFFHSVGLGDFSSRRMILPVAVMGRVSTKVTLRGYS